MTIPTHPRIRALEAIPVQEDGRTFFVLHDPLGLAESSLQISSREVLVLFQLMDGSRSLDEITDAFRQTFQQEVPRDQLEQMVAQLDEAHLLDSPAFEAYYGGLVERYREGPARMSAEAASFGAEDGRLEPLLAGMLETPSTFDRDLPSGRVAGLIAPHLDYPRGTPCYAEAYRLLAGIDPPERVIILGTNHFGRATSVVATGKDFQTPLGLTRTDRAFIDTLSDRCAYDLLEHEYDHQREHSVELQVLILQHLFGADAFEIVPALCHNPCGPTGTAPYDGHGVDLTDFSSALGEAIRQDDKSTLVIAGADLSHVGRHFGNDRDLDDDFLHEVAEKDLQALDAIDGREPDEFLSCITARENDTQICSAGCIYALMTALPEATPRVLRYHQAVDPSAGICVSCAAAGFWDDS